MHSVSDLHSTPKKRRSSLHVGVWGGEGGGATGRLSGGASSLTRGHRLRDPPRWLDVWFRGALIRAAHSGLQPNERQNRFHLQTATKRKERKKEPGEGDYRGSIHHSKPSRLDRRSLLKCWMTSGSHRERFRFENKPLDKYVKFIITAT